MANRKITAMHREYGKDCAHKCADCPNLFVYIANKTKTCYKCMAYGVSSSEASDWAKSWTACGMYGHPARKGDTPLFERLKHAKRKADVEPLDGQISMWEEGKA